MFTYLLTHALELPTNLNRWPASTATINRPEGRQTCDSVVHPTARSTLPIRESSPAGTRLGAGSRPARSHLATREVCHSHSYGYSGPVHSLFEIQLRESAGAKVEDWPLVRFFFCERSSPSNDRLGD